MATLVEIWASRAALRLWSQCAGLPADTGQGRGWSWPFSPNILNAGKGM